MFLRVSVNKVNLLQERIGVYCSETEVWFRERLISLPCTCFVHAAMKTAIELQALSVSIFLWTHQGIAALTASPCFSSLNPQISCEAHLSNIHMIMISKLVINNQRLKSEGDSDWRSRSFCSVSVLCVNCVSFTRVTGGQNTRDQITRGRRSTCSWLNCVLCIPFILSEVQTKAGYIHATHTY